MVGRLTLSSFLTVIHILLRGDVRFRRSIAANAVKSAF
jgi:hypothetical protein